MWVLRRRVKHLSESFLGFRVAYIYIGRLRASKAAGGSGHMPPDCSGSLHEFYIHQKLCKIGAMCYLKSRFSSMSSFLSCEWAVKALTRAWIQYSCVMGTLSNTFNSTMNTYMYYVLTQGYVLCSRCLVNIRNYKIHTLPIYTYLFSYDDSVTCTSILGYYLHYHTLKLLIILFDISIIYVSIQTKLLTSYRYLV